MQKHTERTAWSCPWQEAPELIGGFVLKTGDVEYDYSLKRTASRRHVQTEEIDRSHDYEYNQFSGDHLHHQRARLQILTLMQGRSRKLVL